jgi:putative redox protein
MTLELAWTGGLRFEAHSKGGVITLDGDGKAGPSPVQALGLALAGCMGADVIDILTKGRFSVEAMAVRFEGERAPTDPRRFVRISLHVRVRGLVPPDRVERALQLSRERYCSVWHSLQPDIEFHTSFEVLAPETRGP